MKSTQNPLLKVQEFGQSIWLDYIRRDMLVSGELQQLVDDDGLRGVTSNPNIFYKAIAGRDDYTSAISSLALEGWDELARHNGPLHIRLILQPLVATIIAIRAGWRDGGERRPVFFWTSFGTRQRGACCSGRAGKVPSARPSGFTYESFTDSHLPSSTQLKAPTGRPWTSEILLIAP